MLNNRLVQFALVIFVLIILKDIDAMASVSDALYEAVDSTIGLMPVVGIFAALGYVSARR